MTDEVDAALADPFLQHITKAPSQYDSLCRSMAAEILRLRGIERAYSDTSTRAAEAEAYCQEHLMPRAWGANMWHAILDDAKRSRQLRVFLRDLTVTIRNRALSMRLRDNVVRPNNGVDADVIASWADAINRECAR
jgi:hypothetical protein